jgi:segregation and condensation protein B
MSLEEVPGGYQLRTKLDNMKFITRAMKARPFKLSGPALEVLAIVAYKQPVVKAEIDEIRGVESGHLLRALMEKGLANFEGKSELPGKPMQYGTTKKFLEIFGLRNLKELPTLSQIDEILPEGIAEDHPEENRTLDQITGQLSREINGQYSEGEEELTKISEQLSEINTSSEFFDSEKVKARQLKEADKADRIRLALETGVSVSNRDRNWLIRYDEALRTNSLDQFTSENEGAEVLETATAAFEEEEDTSIDQDLALETDFEPDDEGQGPSLG